MTVLSATTCTEAFDREGQAGGCKVFYRCQTQHQSLFRWGGEGRGGES